MCAPGKSPISTSSAGISLSKKLGLKEGEVLRLAKKNVYPKEEVLQLIKEHQTQRPK
jgi:hypothetical protein